MKRAIAAAVAATLLGACSGGGGGGGTGPLPGGAGNGGSSGGSSGGGSTSPTSGAFSPTSYAVYTAPSATAGQIVGVSLAADGPPDSVRAWTRAGKSYVVYPDASIQTTDGNGVFNAALSSWAQSNRELVAMDPNASPSISVIVPATAGTAARPYGTSIQPYGFYDDSVSATGFSADGVPNAPADLASVTVVPSGVGVFGGETRQFTAIGSDTEGGRVNLAAAVQWTVTVPAGCANAPAGTLSVSAHNHQIVTYTAPADATYPPACQDVVTASATSGGARAGTFSGSGNAFYYAPSQGVTLSGKVALSNGSPAGGSIVDLFDGGRLFYANQLLALTDATGSFSIIVPPNRSLLPVAGNIALAGNAPSIQYFSVTPQQVSVGNAGSAKMAPVTFTETAPYLNPFGMQLPNADRDIEDANHVGELALENVPFSLPNASGVFAKCSVNSYITGASSLSDCGNTVGGGGEFTGWSASVDPSSTHFVFAEPVTQQNGRRLLAITTGVTSVNAPYGVPSGVTCSSTSACFSFVRYYNPDGFGGSVGAPLVTSTLPAGTVLSADGGFSESGLPSAFHVNLVRNLYTSGHQTPGLPAHTHIDTFDYTLGAPSVTFSDAWYNPHGSVGGSFSFTRTTQTGNGEDFTFSGSGTRTFYHMTAAGSLASDQVSYQLTNGVQNSDLSSSFAVTIANSTAPSDDGVTVMFNETGGSGSTATGTVNNPNASGLAHPPTIASFSVDKFGFVTLQLDPNYGGNPQSFVL